MSPTFGLIKEFDAGNIWSAATEVWMAKSCDSGKEIAQFQPVQGAQVWRNKIYGRRQIRLDAVAESDPIFYQCKIWWQGEADANTGRDASNVSHVDITSYDTEFEKVYDFEEAQMGTQPPWFLVQLLKDGEVNDDVYTAAVNAKLKGLCRYSVALNGTITDNANGGNTNRYFVEHNLVNGNNVHATAEQAEDIGQAIATALAELQGSDGYSDTRTVLPKPVLLTQTAGSFSANSLPIDFTVTDAGVIYMAAVATGASAPTAAQIVAGTGGGITNADDHTTGTGLVAGVSVSTTFAGLTYETDIDVYAVLVSDTVSSQVETVATGLSVPAEVLAAATWDATYETGLFTYSNSDLTVTNSAGANRHARSATGKSSGKFYFEVHDEDGSLFAVGLGEDDLPLGGGTHGTNRVGWQFSNNKDANNSSTGMGVNIKARTVIGVAIDLDNELYWIKGDTDDWNNNASADPATGTAGFDLLDIATYAPLHIYAGLEAGVNAATLVTVPGDQTYTAPSGFGQW